jgi:alanine racemase
MTSDGRLGRAKCDAVVIPLPLDKAKPLDAPRAFAETRSMGAAELTIDLDAVAENWRALNAMSAAQVETAVVVKADGYGLDAGRVAARLAREGVRSFFVAVAEEGAEVRRATGAHADIYVFSGHMQGDTDILRKADLIPLLNSPEQVARHTSECPDAAFGVQLDSGMNRLGIEPTNWGTLKDQVLARVPRLIMSHLACADEPDHSMNVSQLRAFRAMTDGIPTRRSLAATGGIILGAEYHFDVVRPGIGLFGGLPFRDANPVVHLTAPVIQTRVVGPGQTVGYGNTYTAVTERRIATISAGYADGLIRTLGTNARVYAGDTPCNVIGRISMDLITVDVSHLEEPPERLSILTDHQGIDDLADAAGTIGYEILTSLGQRYIRHYRGAS